MVIELSGEQFCLKLYACFQNRTSSQREIDLKSQVQRVQLVVFEKIYKCLFIPKRTKKIMRLRVNNIYGKIRDGLL